MKAMRCSAPRSGFTLVEIMVVVVIIGMLAGLAIPAYQRVKRRSQNTTVANDFRVFSQAFESYATENGGWPPNAAATVIPTGMTNALRTSSWQTVTPIGGNWNWDKGIGSVTAGVSITGYTCTDAQLAEIDALLDDGDLANGNFQKVSNGRVTLILED